VTVYDVVAVSKLLPTFDGLYPAWSGASCPSILIVLYCIISVAKLSSSVIARWAQISSSSYCQCILLCTQFSSFLSTWSIAWQLRSVITLHITHQSMSY